MVASTGRQADPYSQRKGVKNQRQRRTATEAEMLESGVRAPLRALSVVRLKEPLEGKHEKKPATALDAPMAKASWFASRSICPNLLAYLRARDQELCTSGDLWHAGVCV